MREDTSNYKEYEANVVLPLSKKICFALGDAGGQCIAFVVSNFFMVFFTNVCFVPIAAFTSMQLFCRVFDAINDPLIGTLLDRSKRKSRYRAWVSIGAAIQMIFAVTMFLCRPEWSESTKIIWMWVFYIMYTLGSTISFMAYRALGGVITTNGKERTTIGAIRGFLIGLSTIPGIFAIPMVAFFSANGSSDATGYITTSLIWGLIGLAFMIIVSATSKERVRKEKIKVPLRTTIKAIFSNRHVLMVFMGYFMFGLLIYGRVTTIYYYCQYVVRDMSVYSLYYAMTIVGDVLGALLVPILFKASSNKGHLTALGLFIISIGSVAIGVLPFNKIMFCIFFVIVAIGMTIFSAMMNSMLGDVADVVEYKNKVRIDGIIGSGASLGQKIGGAISPAIASAMMAAAGFVSGADTQSDAVLNTISFNVWILPAIFGVIAGIIFLFYKINNKQHNIIVNELDERRCLESEITTT